MSKHSIDWFASKSISLLKWPSCALDMNPIENLWAILARRVYYNPRQFSSLVELKETIFTERNGLSDEVVQAHIDSIQPRYIAVLTAQGAKPKY